MLAFKLGARVLGSCLAPNHCSSPPGPVAVRSSSSADKRSAPATSSTSSPGDPTTMSQFVGSEEKLKKPLLVSAMKKLPPSFLSEAQVFTLLAALLFACFYAGFAAYNLRDRDPQEPEPACLVRCYVVTGADAVGASRALLRGLLRCSALQATAAVLALAQLAGGRRRRGLGVRAAAFVALAATAGSHWMYLRMLGLFLIDSPGDLYLAFETASVVAAAALDLLGFLAFVLGGDE